MNKNDQVEKNIDKAFEFIKKAIEIPSFLANTEDNSYLGLSPKDHRSAILKSKPKGKDPNKLRKSIHSKES